MVIDAKKSWSNLPFALGPACVGLCLVIYPWVGGLDPAMTAPIMVPFGLVWLLLGACINHYHSELILDGETMEVIYRSSLILHSWDNRVSQDNVVRVLLTQEDSKYRFIMEVVEGENLSVTTFDYWRSREWSEQVAAFLEVPLVDECRDGREVLPEELRESIQEQKLTETFEPNPPGKISYEAQHGKRATISIPPRGFLPSARPRLLLGLVVFLVGLAGVFLASSFWRWPTFLGCVVVAVLAWVKPLAQATHREDIEVSPNGILVSITTLGRSKRKSVSAAEIRQITVVVGEDARFERTDFDRHAVCVEGPDIHLQLGSNLPKLDHVEWLRRALLHGLTR